MVRKLGLLVFFCSLHLQERYPFDIRPRCCELRETEKEKKKDHIQHSTSIFLFF